MLLARVNSRVVATAKWETLPNRAMLSVTPIEGFGSPSDEIIALDSVQAGPGDLVLVLQEGSGARQAVFDEGAPAVALPAQAVIVGIVDQVSND